MEKIVHVTADRDQNRQSIMRSNCSNSGWCTILTRSLSECLIFICERNSLTREEDFLSETAGYMSRESKGIYFGSAIYVSVSLLPLDICLCLSAYDDRVDLYWAALNYCIICIFCLSKTLMFI